MNYISLGSSCSVAYQLQKLNLKKETLPFDWIRTPNISFVLELIKNNFINFFDNLEFVKDDEKFPFIEDNEDFDKVLDKKTKIYKNENIGFFHDFKDNITLDDVKEKYNRRIIRFYNLIKTPSIFIRDEIKFKESNIPIYNELNKELKKYNINNKLVLIINTFKIKTINLETLDKDIQVFIDTDKISEWQHPSILSHFEKII
jgi:hypothetical protein